MAAPAKRDTMKLGVVYDGMGGKSLNGPRDAAVSLGRVAFDWTQNSPQDLGEF